MKHESKQTAVLATVLPFRSKLVDTSFGPNRIEDVMPDDYWISLHINNFISTYMVIPENAPLSTEKLARKAFLEEIRDGKLDNHSLIYGMLRSYGRERVNFVINELFLAKNVPIIQKKKG